MNRLHVPASELGAASATIRGESLAYLRDVLRLRPGAPLEVFDGEGRVYAARLEGFADDAAELSLGPAQERRFHGVRVTLAQGLPKGDKFELVVQKAVELGARAVIPVATGRSIVRLDERKAADRVARWQRIADEAARQCGRADVMAVGAVTELGDWVGRPPAPDEVRLVLDEEERTRPLRAALVDSSRHYVMLIGPEGGLTREEVAQAKAAGFVPVTLGPRILRTETAGLAVLSIVQHVLGDLG
jgi:16S rRNA (uracil1498-N3)-methyltransferase